MCSVAWQRQHVHLQQHTTRSGIRQTALGGETLPVVELKPFTKKVWRREKSLPNFYEKPPPLKDDGAGGSETTRPRHKAGPAPDIMRYIRELSEQQRTVDSRQSADSTQRYRSQLLHHPKADFSFQGVLPSQHQQDIIPSFTSRHERTKTTLAEDGGGVGAAATAAVASVGGGAATGNVSDRSTGGGGGGGGAAVLGREVSNLLAAYTRDKPLQQQQVCLTGDKLSMDSLGRRQLSYLNPFSAYRQKQPWSAQRPDNAAQSGLSPRHHHFALSTSGRGGAMAASANGHVSRRDLVLSGSTFHHTDRIPLQSLKNRHSSSPHKFHNKLGAAQDSLLVLSQTGAPTVLEKNLFFDQEVRLERCRRERSFAAVGETNVLATAHYVAYDSQPTQGEIHILRAQKANKSRDSARGAFRRNGLQKPISTLPPFRPHFSSLILGRVVDDSPRSMGSQAGDSGTPNSPRNTADRAGDVDAGLEEAIPEHPAVSPQPGSPPPGSRQSAGLDTWATKDELLVLAGESGGDYGDSTEEYRRPLSDTAATETVHVRNEQTPMSAENKARFLPRDDAYLETVESERGRTSHTQHREGFVATVGSSGAETRISDALTTEDRQTESPTGEHSGQSDSEQAQDQTPKQGDEAGESIDFANKKGTDTEPDNALEDSQLSADTDDSQTAGPRDLVLMSVNSSATSQGNLDEPMTRGDGEEHSLENQNASGDTATDDRSPGQAPTEQEPSASSEAHHQQEPGVPDSERNVSKTLVPREVSCSDHSSLSGSPEDNHRDPAGNVSPSSESSSVSSGIVQESPEEKTSEVKASDGEFNQSQSQGGAVEQPPSHKDGEPSAPARGDSQDNDATDSGQSQNGSKGVETVVTVTMEPGQGAENFDGSKTFLTTTNVESEEWKNNMVKV